MLERLGEDSGSGAFVEALRLRLALEAGRLGTWRWDMAAGRVEWDERLEAIFGFEPGTFDGTYETYVERLHPDERDEIQAAVRQAVAQKVPYDIEHRIRWRDGSIRWIQGRGDVTTDVDGNVTGTIGCVADISERKQHETTATALMQQLALLAEASTVLADSMDLAETFDRIATLCVPQIADAVVFWLAREDGPQVVVARHSKAVGQVALERLIDDYAPQLGLGAVDAAMRSGVLQVVRRVTAADVDALVVDETHRLLLQQLELAAGVAVPVVMRRKVLGVVAFAVRQGVELSEETIAFAKELAARLPHAVQNSMLFESATTIAAALQAGLAPSPPPSLESFNIATRYEAAGDGVEIGGDFYDFVDVGANEFVVIVGDVCGRGPSAASLNAQVRFGARALARTGIGPVELATHLNENVVADATDQRFCTAVFAHLSIAESIAAEIVTAGHPSPMILRRDGTVYEIATTGPLLGVFPGATYESTSVIVGQGDTLIMLTDGLLEARDAEGAFFEPLLVPLVEGLVGRTVDEIADAITKAVRLFTGGPQLDDIAIVVIQPSTRSDSPKAVQ